MRISLIGAGRVAHHLAQVLSHRHQIIQICSRTYTNAKALANIVHAEAVTELSQLDPKIDLILIAVSDQSIASVIEELHTQIPNVLIAHTSGSTHIDVLRDRHVRAGVFYPLQTFSLELEIDWKNTPVFIEAANKIDSEILRTLAQQISQRVYTYSSAQRLSLHLAAVFACNFSNYCYDMAKQVVDAESVDFSLLYPLIGATAQKALNNDPKEMQTGPAMRGDQNIIAMHQDLLARAGRADLQQVYTLLSEQILQRHQS